MSDLADKIIKQVEVGNTCITILFGKIWGSNSILSLSTTLVTSTWTKTSSCKKRSKKIVDVSQIYVGSDLAS